MGFRFFRRIELLPGATLNLSKKGASVSLGSRGFRFTVGSSGKRATFGIPGTGLYYISRIPPSRREGKVMKEPRWYAWEDSGGTLSPSFFRRLFIPEGEERIIDGCRELAAGNHDFALDHFRRSTQFADGAWLAGCLCMQKGLLHEAEIHLKDALEKRDGLGKTLSRYGIQATMVLPVTDELEALIEPGERGTMLALAEVLQRLGRREEALAQLERLHSLGPEDLVVKASLVELLLEDAEGDPERLKGSLTSQTASPIGTVSRPC